MEQRLSLVTLGVSDLARARRFYEDGLGWRRGNDEPGVAFYEMPGGILALWSRESLAADARVADTGVGIRGITPPPNTRSRGGGDALPPEAGPPRARLLKPAEEVFWGGYSGYFADPDGHVWEVAHNPFWTITADGRVSLARRPGA